MGFRVNVTGTGGGCLVVLWLVVWSSVKHSASSITSAGGMQRAIMFWDHLGVESSCGEVVLLSVDHIWLQYITGLLSGTLLQELVVNLDVWYVSFVAWNDRRLLSDRALAAHIIV